MIEGAVDDDGVPLIFLRVGDLTQAVIVDTGFNGDLELPESCLHELEPRFVGSFRSILAGGISVEEDVSSITLDFDGRLVVAETTFSTEPLGLLGTRLLRDHRLEIDFVKRTLWLTRIGETVD